MSCHYVGDPTIGAGMIMDNQRMNACVVCEGLSRTSPTGVNELNVHYLLVYKLIMGNYYTVDLYLYYNHEQHSYCT